MIPQRPPEPARARAAGGGQAAGFRSRPARRHGTAACREALSSGAAWAAMQRIIAAQGANPAPPQPAKLTELVLAPVSGAVRAIDNHRVARIARMAGAPAFKGAGVDLFLQDRRQRAGGRCALPHPCRACRRSQIRRRPGGPQFRLRHQRGGMSLTLSFFGAAGTVTGSCYLLEAGRVASSDRLRPVPGRQDAPRAELRRAALRAPEPAGRAAHPCAYRSFRPGVPRLVKGGYAGPVYTTAGSADLLRWMLPDSAMIQEMEVERLNRRNQRRGRDAVQPIYTSEDAARSLKPDPHPRAEHLVRGGAGRARALLARRAYSWRGVD